MYRKAIVCVLLICNLFVLVGCHTLNSNNNRIIKIGILRVPNDMTVAKKRGLIQKSCSQYGYKVEFIPFDSGVDENKALSSNNIQLATMGHTNAVVALAADIPAKLVWVNEIIGSNEALAVTKTSQIKTLSDLRGKAIATPFASTSHYSLLKLLKAHHLLDKVHLLDMQTTEIVAAWKRGNLDAAYTWEPSLSNLNDAIKLTDSELESQRGIMTANVTLASKAFIKENPRLLAKIINNLNDVHESAHYNWQSIYHDCSLELDLTPNKISRQIGSSKWLSDQTQINFMRNTFIKQFYITAQFMHQQQVLNRSLSYHDCSRFITSKFIYKGSRK